MIELLFEGEKVNFSKLRPFLIGNPKQFIVYQGEVFCLRKECDGCPYLEGCEFDEEPIQVDPIEHPRRGLAFEIRPFLILRLKEGLDFEKDVPKCLWDSEWSHLALDEINLHYLLADQKAIFRVLKGQFRYYGSSEEFEASKYSNYFTIFDSYEPEHYIMAMDLSAIEPRVSTIASREPLWIEIFRGKPKVVAKEIKLKDK